MCRALLYLGQPLLVDHLLFSPDNSLVKQSYNPKLMSTIQNLAGFGLSAWNSGSANPELPLLYKTMQLPFYDHNLGSLSKKIKANSALAHVRGTIYSLNEVVIPQNAHPFIYHDTHLAMAHNGQLTDINKMKRDLYELIDPVYATQMGGTTDSEWIYALLLSQLPKQRDQWNAACVSKGVIDTLEVLAKIRKQKGIKVVSPINLFITAPDFIISTRFVFDYGYYPEGYGEEHYAYHTLWFTRGECYESTDGDYRMTYTDNNSSIIIASEPLTEDTTSWIEIPEYTLISAERKHETLELNIQDIDI